MFYEVTPFDISTITYNEINSEHLTIGYLTLEEFSHIYEEMGYDDQTLEQLSQQTTSFQNAASIHRTYCFGIFHIIASSNPDKVQHKIGVYLSHNLLLIVEFHSTDNVVVEYLQTVINRIPKFCTCSLAQSYVSFITCFLTEDHKILEKLERKLQSLEKQVLNDHIDQIRRDLFYYRRQLLQRKNYYEQFITITEEFSENTNQLFNSDDISLLNHFITKVKRLQEHTRDLSEYVSQIKESYMAQLDIDLNRTMKFFTVYTTIFMPLSLIVGWYGMNFKMPELSWRFGYLWVIILCILVTIICIVIIRKRKF